MKPYSMTLEILQNESKVQFSKATAALFSSICESLKGGRAGIMTTRSGSELINRLRSFNIDCELDGQIIRGTIEGKPWELEIIYPKI